jgi:hypothetical protein
MLHRIRAGRRRGVCNILAVCSVTIRIATWPENFEMFCYVLICFETQNEINGFRKA